MITTTAGAALAAVTFSLGSPINDYALTSSNGASADTSADNSPDDSSRDGEVAANPESLPLLALSGGDSFSLYAGDVNLAAAVETTTTTQPTTTTTIGWSEPVIAPESEWVDAGHGVPVPDVLLRIRFCESTNDYQAAHVSSSARGAYQFLSGSWSWYGHADRYGVATADLATPAQQDEAAVITLNKDGTRPWRESFGCWGTDSISPNYATARPPRTTTTTASSSTTETTSGETTTTQQSTTASTQPSTTAASTSEPSTTTSTTSPSSTSSSSSSTTTGSTTTSATGG